MKACWKCAVFVILLFYPSFTPLAHDGNTTGPFSIKFVNKRCFWLTAKGKIISNLQMHTYCTKQLCLKKRTKVTVVTAVSSWLNFRISQNKTLPSAPRHCRSFPNNWTVRILDDTFFCCQHASSQERRRRKSLKKSQLFSNKLRDQTCRKESNYEIPFFFLHPY